MLSAPSEHSDHMQTALSLARRGLGNVWPNPAVGCVIVKDGRVVGRGWTQPGGRPHSETGALKQAGSQAKGATAYVTLEPCNHHGQTPPCTDALIEAGISKVVISCLDPDSRVSGTGAARLKEAGIQVEIGIYAKEGRAINCGFFSRIEYKRPVFTLKVATTLDGRIATQGGESQWITGPEARRAGEQDCSLATWARITRMRAVDVVQPDVCYLGGISRTMRVVRMAEAAGLPVTPHCANLSMVTLFTMHLLRTIPNAGKYLEFSIEGPDYYPWQEGLFVRSPYEISDGMATVTEAPGWGVEIRPEWLERAEYRVSEVG